nr:relaxase domain-containing protein [Leucobacter insecticola]
MLRLRTHGTPPWRRPGSGLTRLGHGQIAAGDEVIERQLRLSIGMDRGPVTGDPLIRAYPECKSVQKRVVERIAALDIDLILTDSTKASAEIEAEESKRGTQKAVAGYDYTFSLPESASVLWAVAYAGLQSSIALQPNGFLDSLG